MYQLKCYEIHYSTKIILSQLDLIVDQMGCGNVKWTMFL